VLPGETFRRPDSNVAFSPPLPPLGAGLRVRVAIALPKTRVPRAGHQNAPMSVRFAPRIEAICERVDDRVETLNDSGELLEGE
jgi:hypothetical protein